MRGNPAYLLALLGLCCFGSVARGQITLNWIGDAPAPWDTTENWDDGTGQNVVPDADFGDSAVINNGGTVQLMTGEQDVVNLNIGNGTFDLTGGQMTVQGNLTNGGTLRLQGSNPQLIVEGNYTNTGRLVAAITGATHSSIDVTGAANLGGTLAVEITGAAPSLGSSWELVNAGSISGSFSNIDQSGAPDLPRGAQYQVLTTGTTATLSVDNSLILSIDRTTGAASISNVIGDAIEIDGYAILSGNGLLNGAGWTSLESGGGGWAAAPATPNSLVELNLTSSSMIDVGESVDAGSPYVGGYVHPADEDVQFQYTSPSGEIVDGIVEYTGPINNIVLAIDPTTGAGEIRNLSPFAQAAASIDGYTIESAAGSLNPGGWTSFEGSGQAGEGWQSAPALATGLAELNLNDSSMFNEGAIVGIGNIFTPGSARDLVFQFSAVGGAAIVGDANGDNAVNLSDFNILKANFGQSSAGLEQGDFNGDGDVNLSDFNLLKANFGQSGEGGGEGGVFQGTVVYTGLSGAAAVPEPSTAYLLILGAGTLAVGVFNRRSKGARMRMNKKSTQRSVPTFVAAIAPVLLACAATATAQDNIAEFGTISQFTGADPGEGLDFEGVFQYAVDVGGAGGVQIGDAQFTNVSVPGFSIESDNIANPWDHAPNVGDSPADNALDFLIHSIQWSNGSSGAFRTVNVSMDNIVPGADYKLQLIFQERCCNRAFDIYIDDELAVIEMFAPGIQGTPETPNVEGVTSGAVYTHEFTAASETLSIVLDGQNTAHPDHNAILNDLTLEIDLSLPGDFNFDGSVDLDDFNTLLTNMLTGDNYAEGDMDFSGKVDLGDFVPFKQAFHSAGAAAVPEPATGGLAAMALLGLVFSVRLYRRRV